jgi:hypothetical protein
VIGYLILLLLMSVGSRGLCDLYLIISCTQFLIKLYDRGPYWNKKRGTYDIVLLSKLKLKLGDLIISLPLLTAQIASTT